MNLFVQTTIGILLPFLGTALGAFSVFFMKKSLDGKLKNTLLGFASGVMIAASVWSLIIPAVEMSQNYGNLAFLPATVGFLSGIFFLLALEKFIARLHTNEKAGERPSSHHQTFMLTLAVTLHNLPEGMAVGVAFAGLLAGSGIVTAAGAMALSLGIAIQNLPEGAVISLPLAAEGRSRKKAFLSGVLSGVVEPIGAALTLLFTALVSPLLPYLLSFSAGAMIYVVSDELIPQAQSEKSSCLPTLGVALGFTLMMVLDIALG